MSIPYCYDCERVIEGFVLKRGDTEICQWCHGPVSNLPDDKKEETDESI